jgi:pyridoxine 5-phosphate synthase
MRQMAGLVVNVDHVATLREARKTTYPDPVAAAALVELAGADGVVIHLREDRRHVKDRDVHIIRQTAQTKLILAMTATKEMVAMALEIRPDLVTLVPEKRAELTTEGGLDLVVHRDHIEDTIRSLHQGGIAVSLSVGPDSDQIKMARRMDADKVEIYTGTFCDAETPEQREEAFQQIVNSAKMASKLKMGVNAGHGLGYKTIKDFQGVREIDEFSIGHSIIARAVMVGMDRAVREMVALIKEL